MKGGRRTTRVRILFRLIGIKEGDLRVVWQGKARRMASKKELGLGVAYSSFYSFFFLVFMLLRRARLGIGMDLVGSGFHDSWDEGNVVNVSYMQAIPALMSIYWLSSLICFFLGYVLSILAFSTHPGGEHPGLKTTCDA